MQTRQIGRLVVLAALLSPLTACIVNEVLPKMEELPAPSGLSVAFEAPSTYQSYNPTASMSIRIRLDRDIRYEGTVDVVLNDSLLSTLQFRAYDSFVSTSCKPANWTDPGTPLSILATAKDESGTVAKDSIVVQIDEYLESAPELQSPPHQQTCFLSVDNSIKLNAADYGGNDNYFFEVATDSTFTGAFQNSTRYSYMTYPLPQLGTYYWRVKIVGQLGVESPWSETRSFHVINDPCAYPALQSMSKITGVARAVNSIYLKGLTGAQASVTCCTEAMTSKWTHVFPVPESADDVNWDILDDGSFYAAVRETDHYGTGWLFLVSAYGDELWQRQLSSDYRGIEAVVRASDEDLVCGLSGSYSPHLVKMDTTGIIAWTYEGDYNRGDCKELRGDAERGMFHFLLRGGSVSYTLGSIELEGDVVALHNVNVPASQYDYSYVLEPTADGAFIMGSTVDTSYDYDHVYLAKILDSGVLVWQCKLQPETTAEWHLGAVREHDDGGFYVVGSRLKANSNSSDAFLARLDSGGNVEWTRVFGSEATREYGQDVLFLEDRVVIVGYIYESATNGPLAIPVDHDGNVRIE